jgi:hypothetical protein
MAILAGAAWTSVEYTFGTSMRAVPTVTYFNPSAANGNWRNVTKAADSGPPTAVTVGSNSIAIANQQIANDALTNTMAIHATFDATL